MISLSQHDVTKVELCGTYLQNGGQREIRITSKNVYTGVEQSMEITLYGDTAALDLLPKSSDFSAYVKDTPLLDEPAAELAVAL